MIFQGIDFHNVEELEQCEKGYRMWRLPAWVREKVNEGVRNTTARYTTGVELRFKLKGDSADIILRAEASEEAQVAYIYHGSFQSGWRTSSVAIGVEETKIHVMQPRNMELMKQISKQDGLPFSPEVIRIVLPYGTCYYVGTEGEVEAPGPLDVTEKIYLAHGSSITHGSLALAAPYSYPFRIGQKMKCDYINLGCAGSAQLEEVMAEYIVSRKDWTFASVEMGINMINFFTVEEFEERVARFTQILGQDTRPIFATSIFGCMEPQPEKIQQFRDIVEKYAGERLIFTDGLKLLNNPCYISADLVHPSTEGVEEIVNNWYPIMAGRLYNTIS